MGTKFFSLAITILAIVLVMGCIASGNNNDQNNAADNQNTGTGNTVEINMRAFQWGFDPSTIEVNKGDRVKLHITSEDVEHGFAISEFGVNANIPAGQSTDVEFVADKAGTFRFFCSVFCGAGHSDMTGQLIVRG